MHFIETDLLHKGKRFFKIRLRFTGKSHDDIGGDGGIVKMFPQDPAAFAVFIRRVVTVHALQRACCAGLQGQMEMRADRCHPGQTARKFLRDDARFQRAQADALHAGDGAHGFNEADEVIAVFQIAAIGRQMNAGQDKFLDTVLYKVLYFPDHIVLHFGTDAAAGIRDDAVGTELIAAVLYLQIRAGVLSEAGNGHFAEALCLRDVRDGIFQTLVQIIGHDSDDFRLLVRAHNDVHAIGL